MIGRMLDITGFARLVQLEPDESAYGHLGPEQSDGERASGADGADHRLVRRDGMTKGTTKFTSIHSDDDLIDGALRLAVSLAACRRGRGRRRQRVPAPPGGPRHGGRHRPERSRSMDANQYETGEGPVRRRLDRGALVSRRIPGERDPMARLHPACAGARDPSHSLVALARGAGTDPVGALNIYSLTPVGLHAVRDQAWRRRSPPRRRRLLSEAEEET